MTNTIKINGTEYKLIKLERSLCNEQVETYSLYRDGRALRLWVVIRLDSNGQFRGVSRCVGMSHAVAYSRAAILPEIERVRTLRDYSN